MKNRQKERTREGHLILDTWAAVMDRAMRMIEIELQYGSPSSKRRQKTRSAQLKEAYDDVCGTLPRLLRKRVERKEEPRKA